MKMKKYSFLIRLSFDDYEDALRISKQISFLRDENVKISTKITHHSEYEKREDRLKIILNCLENHQYQPIGKVYNICKSCGYIQGYKTFTRDINTLILTLKVTGQKYQGYFGRTTLIKKTEK